MFDEARRPLSGVAAERCWSARQQNYDEIFTSLIIQVLFKETPTMPSSRASVMTWPDAARSCRRWTGARRMFWNFVIGGD
jgi:hypothetical protein